MKRSRQQMGVGRCPNCGKISYTTRKHARANAKRLHPGEEMSAYPCGEYWHIGHTPYAIKRGFTARKDRYAPNS